MVAAVSGVVTALVTTHPSRGLWVALVVAVSVGATLQGVAAYSERRKRGRVSASGPGAVAIDRSAQEVRTRVADRYDSPVGPHYPDGVTASGPGAVAIGGDAAGPISTEVTGGQARQRNEQI
jgi:hypothetical protein